MDKRRKGILNPGLDLISIAVLVLLFTTTVIHAAPRVEYYHTDALGSVVASTDESGNVLWRESYRPFGDRILKEVSTQDNTPFYTGKPHDDATGLSYFGARYYDPYIGRFIGVDPVGVDPANLHSFNRYAYANNNPYRYVDPDGREVVITGPKPFQTKTEQAVNQIKSTPSGKELYNHLDKSSNTHTIVPSSSGNSAMPDTDYEPGKGAGSTIKFNPDSMRGGVDSEGSSERPPFVGLGHEMGHSEAIDQGRQVFDRGTGVKGTTPPSESNSIQRENQIRSEHKLPSRSSYY